MANRKKQSLKGTDNSPKPDVAKYQQRAVNQFGKVLKIMAGMAGGGLIQNAANSMFEQSGATTTAGIDGKKIVVNVLTILVGGGAGVMYGDNPHVEDISTGVMLSGMKELGQTVMGKDITNISFAKNAALPKTTEEKKPLGSYNENELQQLPDDFFLDGADDYEPESDFAEDVEFETY